MYSMFSVSDRYNDIVGRDNGLRGSEIRAVVVFADIYFMKGLLVIVYCILSTYYCCCKYFEVLTLV